MSYIANPEFSGKINIKLRTDTFYGVSSSPMVKYKTTFIGLIFNKTGGDSRFLIDITGDNSKWENYYYNFIFKSTLTGDYLQTDAARKGSNNTIANKFYNCIIDSDSYSFNIYPKGGDASVGIHGAIN